MKLELTQIDDRTWAYKTPFELNERIKGVYENVKNEGKKPFKKWIPEEKTWHGNKAWCDALAAWMEPLPEPAPKRGGQSRPPTDAKFVASDGWTPPAPQAGGVKFATSAPAVQDPVEKTVLIPAPIGTKTPMTERLESIRVALNTALTASRDAAGDNVNLLNDLEEALNDARLAVCCAQMLLRK